jgi:hypothetical protein
MVTDKDEDRNTPTAAPLNVTSSGETEYQWRECEAHVLTLQQEVLALKEQLERRQAAANDNTTNSTTLVKETRGNAEEMKVNEEGENDEAESRRHVMKDAMSKELETLQETVDVLQEELTRERQISRAQNITFTMLTKDADMARLALEQERQQRMALQSLYDEAVNHLANPLFSEYLQARGDKMLLSMRPELRAALEKAKAVVPLRMSEAVAKGKDVLVQSHEQLRSNVVPYVGNAHANWIALGLLVFLMAPPTYLVWRFLQSIRRRLQVHHYVLALNFIAMSFFAAVAFASLVFQENPLMNLQTAQPAMYTLLQFALALFCLCHVGASLILACAARSPFLVKGLQCVHVVSSLAVTGHYYDRIWSKAMLDQRHEVPTTIFALYAMVFMLGLLPAFLSTGFARLRDDQQKRSR